MHLLIGLPFPPFCSLLLPANPHVCVCICIVWVLISSLFRQKECVCVCVFRTAGGRFIRLNAGFMVQLKKGLRAFPPVLGPPHIHVKTHPSCSSDKGMKCVTRYTGTGCVVYILCLLCVSWCLLEYTVLLNVPLGIFFFIVYRQHCVHVFMERGSGLELCVRHTHTVWTYGALTAINNLILLEWFIKWFNSCFSTASLIVYILKLALRDFKYRNIF